jgi:hypothetical protein
MWYVYFNFKKTVLDWEYNLESKKCRWMSLKPLDTVIGSSLETHRSVVGIAIG